MTEPGPDRPRDPWNLTDSDAYRLRRAFLEQESRTVLTLDPEPEPTRPPVPYLLVPADDTCDHPPPAQWRASTLRQVLPAAVGVSQCIRTVDHDGDVHIGLVFLPTDGDGPAVAQQAVFPAEVG